MKQEHQKDLRLRRITRCEVGRLAGTKSSVAASACRRKPDRCPRGYALCPETDPAHPCGTRPACLPAPRLVVADSFTPAPGRVCGPDLASRPGFRGRGQGIEEEGGREGGACAFERGMSVLPSASPMYSVCGNSPAAEAPASARSRRCPIRGCSRWHKQGQNTRRLEDQGGAGGPECLLLLLTHDERGIAWLVLQPGSSTTG